MKRSETMWAIVRHGHVFVDTISLESSAARQKLVRRFGGTWKNWYECGDRCVRVTVTWEEPER